MDFSHGAREGALLHQTIGEELCPACIVYVDNVIAEGFGSAAISGCTRAEKIRVIRQESLTPGFDNQLQKAR